MFSCKKKHKMSLKGETIMSIPSMIDSTPINPKLPMSWNTLARITLITHEVVGVLMPDCIIAHPDQLVKMCSPQGTAFRFKINWTHPDQLVKVCSRDLKDHHIRS